MHLTPNKSDTKQLTKNETTEEGNVSFSVIWKYAKSIGYWNVFAMIITNAFYVGSNAAGK